MTIEQNVHKEIEVTETVGQGNKRLDILKKPNISFQFFFFYKQYLFQHLL